MRSLVGFKRVVFAAVAAMGIVAQGEVKVVRVVPNGEAGENPDGASWATAYGDIKTAYESLGADGGEVWIKKGLYIMSNAVEMAANVSVYGGFAGTETSRAAADPKNNTTLITGDQELNDKLMSGSPRVWRYNTIMSAWNYETLEFQEYEPSYTYSDSSRDYYFWTPWPQNIYNYSTPSMSADDKYNQKLFDTLLDTGCAFRHAADAARLGDVTYEGLVFSGFKTNIFYVAGTVNDNGPDMSMVTLRNCRFLGCCNGLAGTSGGAYCPVYLANARATLTGCEFNRCLNGIKWSAGGLLTNELSLVVTNCQFRYVTSVGGSAPLYVSASKHPTPASSPTMHVVDCTFEHNYGLDGSGCGISVWANGLVERCAFENNWTYRYGTELVRTGGNDNWNAGKPRVEFRNLRFVGNEIRHDEGQGTTIAFKASKSDALYAMAQRYPIVRDCYFASNKVYSVKTRGYQFGLLYNCADCSMAFVNCCAEDNTIEYDGSAEDAKDYSGVGLSLFNGKGIFINCAVKGTKLIDSSTRNSALNPVLGDFYKNQTFINTVAWNENADGKYVFRSGCFLSYDTLATGLTDMTGVSFTKTKPNVQGTPMFGVKTTPDKRPGRAVWDIGWDFTVYDPDYDKTKPWRSFHDYRLGNDGCAKNPPAVLVDGLNDTEHLIPDANGKVRYRMKNGVPKIGEAYGPLCATVDGIGIFVR